jgi:hypothetical protein
MVAMDLDVTGWYRRGQGGDWMYSQLAETLLRINDRIRQADQRLADAPGMSTTGYSDRTEQVNKVLADLKTINAYHLDLRDDIATRLDEPLFQAFSTGPTQALSLIRTEDITTPNTVGVRVRQRVTSPGGSHTIMSELKQITFTDFTGTGTDESAVPGFATIFDQTFHAWSSDANTTETWDYNHYITELFHSGEYDHRTYDPIASFATTILDLTIVWAIYKAITGHDPLTGVDLTTADRWVESGMSIVNLVALILTVPTAGAAALKAGAATAARMLLVEALSTSTAYLTNDLALTLDLPDWAAALAALGIHTIITIAGSKYYVLETLDHLGQPTGRTTIPIGPDVNLEPIKAQPELPVVQRADEIRTNLPPKLRREGNVAVADVNIPNLPNEFFAFSRIQDATSKGALDSHGAEYGFSYLRNEDQLLLSGYQEIGGYFRSVDTEAKILEDIASRTDSETIGSIVLYTELKPCTSCEAVIDSFRTLRKNITVTVIYG